MAKSKDKWQFGDFQTPNDLAERVCDWLARQGVVPDFVVEPTCGKGSFVRAANNKFPKAKKIYGFEINPDYLELAHREINSPRVVLEQRDFFRADWNSTIDGCDGRLLVLGNPPWVTSAELGALESQNLPTKSNFQGRTGLDALTGKANFDISEWMLLQNAEWLERKSGYLAVLCKQAVARKILKQLWERSASISRASIVLIDAMAEFNAAVEACLLFVEFSNAEAAKEASIFHSFDSCTPDHILGFSDGELIADIREYQSSRHILGTENHYRWRSGVKHDCSRVMELRVEGSTLVNGLGDTVDIEEDFLFPLYKSSDIAKDRLPKIRRFVIVPQRAVGEPTDAIREIAPKTWDYLLQHSEALDKRGSSIYRNRPRFSVFGIGPYSFTSHKVAIAGLYKKLQFSVLEPIRGKPVMVDDTAYFLPANSRQEADFLFQLLNSDLVHSFLHGQVFWDAKRPITVDLLKRFSVEKAAKNLGCGAEYEQFSRPRADAQLEIFNAVEPAK
jgi:methylase of polypeptide subunit release factors